MFTDVNIRTAQEALEEFLRGERKLMIYSWMEPGMTPEYTREWAVYGELTLIPEECRLVVIRRAKEWPRDTWQEESFAMTIEDKEIGRMFCREGKETMVDVALLANFAKSLSEARERIGHLLWEEMNKIVAMTKGSASLRGWVLKENPKRNKWMEGVSQSDLMKFEEFYDIYSDKGRDSLRKRGWLSRPSLTKWEKQTESYVLTMSLYRKEASEPYVVHGSIYQKVPQKSLPLLEKTLPGEEIGEMAAYLETWLKDKLVSELEQI